MPVPEGEPNQELSDQGIDSLTGFVEDYVSAGLGDLNYAVTDLPNFLADTAPVTTAALFPKTVLRQACRSYARGGGPQNLPGFDVVWGGICEPFLDSIDESPTPGSVGPPFTGGQCVGVQYRIEFSYTNDQGNRQSIEQIVGAPLVGVYTEPRPNNGPTVGYVLRNADGTTTRFLQAGLQDTGIPPAPSVRVLRREDNLPDNCGNPPSEFDPPRVRPGLPPLPPTIPIDVPGLGPVNVGVTFSPSGQVNVSLPDIGIEVPIDAPFSFDGGGGDGEPGGGGGVPPGDVGEPGTPEVVGDGGEAEGTAPEGSVLVGVRVQITAFPPSRTKYTDDVFRGAYYCYMGTPGLLDLDFGGAMVRLDQFLLAEKDWLTSWRVSANTGYELVVTPYYREVE